MLIISGVIGEKLVLTIYIYTRYSTLVVVVAVGTILFVVSTVDLFSEYG